MEPLKLFFRFDKEAFIQSQQLKRELETRLVKKNNRNWLFVFPVCVLFCLITYYGNTLLFSVFCSLTICFALIACLTYIQTKNETIIYTKKLHELAEKHADSEMDFHFEFTEDQLKYWDKDKHLYFAWSMLSKYAIHNHWLIIWVEGTPYFMIELIKLEQSIYNQLMNVLKSKLPLIEVESLNNSSTTSNQLIDQ